MPPIFGIGGDGDKTLGESASGKSVVTRGGGGGTLVGVSCGDGVSTMIDVRGSRSEGPISLGEVELKRQSVTCCELDRRSGAWSLIGDQLLSISLSLDRRSGARSLIGDQGLEA